MASNSNKPPQPQAAAGEIGAPSSARQRQNSNTNDTTDGFGEPPRFVIDLSLPPERRYVEVCAALKSEIARLTPLFDEVVGGLLPWLPIRWLHALCSFFLRGVYDNEESAELLGISSATAVPMYLLVCFNVLLDLFMGCSSGGAAVQDDNGLPSMLHFRTLDWDMPALRRTIVQLEFVQRKGGPVIASSITYAGFVGVLTGVRRGFSVSLNFRPHRTDSGNLLADLLYSWHLLAVLLGWRPSIASVLRGYLLPRVAKDAQPLPSYTVLMRQYRERPAVLAPTQSHLYHARFTSTSCYLCFCSGQETTVVEKDRVFAKLRSSTHFIVVTNNDEQSGGHSHQTDISTYSPAVVEIVQEAQNRKKCAEQNWARMTSARSSSLRSEDVVQLVQKYPTTNEMTHFACVMDPNVGLVHWCRVWKKPVSRRMKEHA